MKNLCVYISDDLYRDFKIQVAKDNTTIKAAILGFLSIYTKEVKNENKNKGGNGGDILAESSEPDKKEGKQ